MQRVSEISKGSTLIVGEKERLANTALYLADELNTATSAFQAAGFAQLDAEEKLEAANTKVVALLDELEAAQKYTKDRDAENEDLMLTVGRLRMEKEAAEKRIAELEAGQLTTASRDVLAERQRQISMEGWKPEHEDEHCNGELAMAAVCYINETGTVNRNGGKPWGWPWDASWWKPKTRRRNLVKAGALILAEIERLDRDAGIGVKGE
ncbi:ead/Ea22-like family protein [Citrobacter portucalensis]|nr:ead/Ea22-like family protein [Citrobacter portucalensis]MEB6521129.1 ead/Ea22-like family protein [Citrobacter portucalensis]